MIVRPPTGNRMMDIGGVNGYDPLYRMTSPDDVINTFALVWRSPHSTR
jgi:hypothetical protein